MSWKTRRVSAALKTSQISKTANAIAEHAKSYVGCPYKHCGRDYDGIDCFGITLRSLNAAGLDVDFKTEEEILKEKFGYSYYTEVSWRRFTKSEFKIASLKILRDFLTKHLVMVKLEQVQEGDILLIAMRVREQDLGDHLAVYVGNDQIVNADMRGDVCLDEFSDYFRRRTVAVFRKVD